MAGWLNLMMLALEAQQVIWMRTMRLVYGGRSAEAEWQHLIEEKATAHARAATAIMTGASPDEVIRGYRRKVRANLRQLQRRRK